jgi:hypothetical protein
MSFASFFHGNKSRSLESFWRKEVLTTGIKIDFCGIHIRESLYKSTCE